MMNRERTIFLPAATLIALLVLYSMFRQRRALAYPLIAISFGLIWMGGLMALTKITINIVSYLTFNLLLIVGASNAIHILVRYYEQLNKGLIHHRALQMVLRRVSPALFLTSFTTATGFFSLITTNVRIVQEFGLLLALGVMVMFLLNISIIPALLQLTPPPSPEAIARHAAGTRLRAARKISEWNESNPGLILAITGAVIIAAMIGITRINTNAAILEDLRPGNKVSVPLMVSPNRRILRLYRHYRNLLHLCLLSAQHGQLQTISISLTKPWEMEFGKFPTLRKKCWSYLPCIMMNPSNL
jgi:predicted RND superfamily exporter protein